MKIITRYIVKTISFSSLVIMFLIFGMQLIIWSLGEVEDLGVGNYHMKEALLVIALQIPYQLCELFPFICLLGGLLGLGQLASNNELVVLRTAGFATKKLVLIILSLAFGLSLMVSLFQEFVAPFAVSIAHNKKLFYTSGGNAIRASGSVWFKDNKDYLHIGSIDHDKIQDINRYQFNKDFKLTKTLYAKEGQIKDGIWHLKNVYHTDLLDSGTVSKLTPEAKWKITVPKNILTLGYVYPEELTIRNLSSYISGNTGSLTRYDLMFWQRIFQPFNMVIMMLLAIPIILGPLRNATFGLRMLVGVGVGFTFHVLDHALGASGVVYQLPIWLMLLMPLVFFIFMGWYLINKYQ